MGDNQVVNVVTCKPEGPDSNPLTSVNFPTWQLSVGLGPYPGNNVHCKFIKNEVKKEKQA